MKKGYEKGRSLTEMLGTLAIMGILSLTGIWAYNAAMDYLKVNTILYEVNKRASACAFEVNMMDRNPCLLAEYPTKIEDTYTVSTVQIEQNSFEIQLAGVPKNICEKILSRGLPDAGMILPTTCQATNTMRFLFDRELTGEAGGLCGTCSSSGPQVCQALCYECQTDADCTGNSLFGSGYKCENSMCVKATPPDWCATCVANGQFCHYNSGSTTAGSCASAAVTPVPANDGKTYYKASVQANWYGAKSFCEVNGMHLVPLNVLCPQNQAGQKCSNFSGVSNWFWTATSKDASSAYIIHISQSIKTWTKTTAGSGVYPLCAP